MDHVAEIDQTDDALADDALVLRLEIIAGADDHVVIVRVVVNRALAKPRQYRLDVAFELSGELAGEAPRFRVRDPD